MIRAIRTITAKDLRQRLRDKSFLLLGIVTPLVLAFVLNLVFGGGGDGEIEIEAGVISNDDSDIASGVVTGLLDMDGSGGFSITDLGPGTDPDIAVDDEGLDAVIVIPEGFGDGVTSGQGPALQVIENPDRPVQGAIVASVADGYANDLERTQLLAAAGAQLGVSVITEESTSDVTVTQEFPAGTGLNSAGRMLAGMAIMFVFFTVSFGVTNLLEERKAGTLTRLLAAPISRDSILTAKALVGFLLGVTATLILMIVGTFLMGAEWGPWIGVVALVLTACLTAVALMAVVAGIAKTTEGANGAQAIIAVALAMLGGSWFPVSDEGLLGAVSKLTPHRWFLEGLEELSGADSWTVVGQPVLAMCVIAVIAGVPAAILLRRKLAP